MAYRIAGIDVHKKVLAVVVSDVEIESEFQFERRMFGSNPEQMRSLAAWLVEQEAEEVVMESTAQYWKPVWGALERYWKPIREKREGARRKSGALHLAQAQSNRGRRGRKRTFPSGEQLSSWVGACPGDEESAGVNYSHRSPKGNVTCGDYSIRRLTPPSKSKEVSSRLSMSESRDATAIVKPSDSLRIDSVV
jgi:transposase